MKTRKNILTIAGFDPSGGAGVLADIKTFEQHKLQSFAVITANTVQTDDVFMSVNWVGKSLLMKQLRTLLERYKFSAVKIGLIQDLTILSAVLDEVKTIPIKIWDPILSSSTGFEFNHCLQDLTLVLSKLDYVTPNWREIQQLTNEEPISGAKTLSKYCKIYLKGGHSEELGKDFLIDNDQITPFKMKILGDPKHGSGCIFSSALASNLAKSFPEIKACLKAKRYIEGRLSSNSTLLAYHSS